MLRRGNLCAGVVAVLALSALTGCDGEPEDVTYLAVASRPEIRRLDRGTYHTTNPDVVAILEQHDASDSGCSGITLVGCPGSEITIQSTMVTFQGVTPGDASIEGISEEGKAFSLAFRVEKITELQVKEVVSPKDNNSPLANVPDELVISSGGSLLLQIYLLGRSDKALGYIETFGASSGDETVASVESFIYSYGYRARIDGVTVGTTSLTLTTPTVERTFQVRVE